MSYLRKISFLYLTLFVLFSVGQDLQIAMTFTTSTDHSIFALHGMREMFAACVAISFTLDLAASYYVLVKPNAIGFWVILVALAFAAFYNIFVFGLAIEDVEATKMAYLSSRESRGIPANPETVDKVFSPEGMQATVGISLFFAMSSLGALAINRRRFFQKSVGSFE